MAITKIWVDDLDKPIIEKIETEDGLQDVIVGYEQKQIEVVSETMKVDDLDKPIYQRDEDGQFVLDENEEKIVIGYGKKWATVHREPTMEDYENEALIEQKRLDEERKQELHQLLNESDIKIKRFDRQKFIGKQTKYTDAEILEIETQREEWATELEQLENS